MGSRGRGGRTALQEVLRPIWDKLRNLEGALADVHPEYAQRTVMRCKELCDLTRGYANEVIEITDKQKVALGTVVYKAGKAQENLDQAICRLSEASNRHQVEAGELRAELGVLKEHISQQASLMQSERTHCEQALQSMKAELETMKGDGLEQLKSMQEETKTLCRIFAVQKEELGQLFSTHKEELAWLAKQVPPQNMSSVVERAQALAANRSPSSRSVSRGRPGWLPSFAQPREASRPPC